MRFLALINALQGRAGAYKVPDLPVTVAARLNFLSGREHTLGQPSLLVVGAMVCLEHVVSRRPFSTTSDTTTV